MVMSQRIRSGAWARAASTPRRPFSAAVTSKPSAFSMSDSVMRMPASSSMTRIFVIETIGQPGTPATLGRRASCRGSLCMGPPRQADVEPGPDAHLGVDGDAAAVQFHRFLGDGEAQARARTALYVGGPVEALEQPRQVLRGNADAAVLDRDADVPVHGFDRQSHRAAGGRILDRVREQVVQYVAQQVLVQFRGLALEAVLEHDGVLLAFADAEFGYY